MVFNGFSTVIWWFSPWHPPWLQVSYGCHTGKIQLQRPGGSNDVDLDQHCETWENIQRKRKLKGNHTWDIFEFDLLWSVLICFDLGWFVGLIDACLILLIENPDSSACRFVSSITIVGQSLLISVSKLFGGWVTILKNIFIFVIGDQHPIVIFEEIYQFWSQSDQP